MITVIIPALNESKKIAEVVRYALRQDDVSEVIVVDDGSIDGTAELAEGAGARVLTSSLLGKGASLKDGLEEAHHEIVVFLDGDMSGFVPDLVAKLTRPIRQGLANFVKAKYARTAGRVTTLTAKPLIQVFFPELACFDQPLGGVIAARKSTLESIELETDYGVDLGMLIDLQMLGETIAEVDIGRIQHISQPLEDLSRMASQVARTILHRAARYGRLQVEQLMETEEAERQRGIDFSVLRGEEAMPAKIALFDMDGTLIDGRFVAELAMATGKRRELAKYLDHQEYHPIERTRAIARIFRGVPMATFVEVARRIPLHVGAVEAVRELRKRGYQVGIISDSFRIATETVRRRVFADFSIAHLMRFERNIASGEIGLCASMFHERGCLNHYMCKRNAILHLCQNAAMDMERLVVVGDGENDVCLLEAAGISIAYRGKCDRVREAASHVVESDLSEVGRIILEALDDLPNQNRFLSCVS